MNMTFDALCHAARPASVRTVLHAIAGALLARRRAARTRALLLTMDARYLRDVLGGDASLHQGPRIAADAQAIRRLADHGR
ncbi:MAG: hypothetical protein IT561_07595 [Alphaproteobacteria bacterium]|nr:hypothetical protein [Alphaproteobacteria bacterium]